MAVSENTLILTKDGHITIKDLKNKDVDAWNGEKSFPIIITRIFNKTELIRVILRDGRFLDCTPDHIFRVDLDDWTYGSYENGFVHTPSTIIKTKAIELKKDNLVRVWDGMNSLRLAEVEFITKLDSKDSVYNVNTPRQQGCILNGILI